MSEERRDVRITASQHFPSKETDFISHITLHPTVPLAFVLEAVSLSVLSHFRLVEGDRLSQWHPEGVQVRLLGVGQANRTSNHTRARQPSSPLTGSGSTARGYPVFCYHYVARMRITD